MKTRIITAFIAFLLFANLVVFAQQGASISSFVPSTTQATAQAFQITITGTGFEGSVQVSLGGVACTVVASSATWIVANVPASANVEGNRELVLTRSGMVIARTVYVIGAMRLPPPRITHAMQDRGIVVIRGENFVTGATAYVHSTGRTFQMMINSFSSNQIIAMIPSGTPFSFNFTVSVINPDGQVAMIAIFSSAKENRLSPVVRLFPNPTTEAITIETSTNAPSIAIFILRNALGQELTRFTKALPSGQVSTPLDMHSFPAGAYFLEVQSGTERVVERLLKH